MLNPSLVVKKSGEFTANFGSVTNGNQISTNVTVKGATVNDFILAHPTSKLNANVTMSQQPFVVAADTVQCVVRNLTTTDTTVNGIVFKYVLI